MRKITKIIIHCAATPEDRVTTVADITKWHKARGFKTIGYHYVIGLNGELWKGRNVEEIGAHCEGQNTNSIGICYVGGIDKDSFTPKDTRNEAQKATLLSLIKELKGKYPQATLHGHKEFANKACPCFEVKKEYPQ